MCLPFVTLWSTTREPRVPSALGSTSFQGLQSPSSCTDRPQRLRLHPTHLHTASVGSVLLFCTSFCFPTHCDPGPSFPPVIVRTSSRFRMLRQRLSDLVAAMHLVSHPVLASPPPGEGQEGPSSTLWSLGQHPWLKARELLPAGTCALQ